MRNFSIDVTFPRSGKTYTFKSVRAVARMLSGTGRASGGLRAEISNKALNGFDNMCFGKPIHDNVVRNNALVG